MRVREQLGEYIFLSSTKGTVIASSTVRARGDFGAVIATKRALRIAVAYRVEGRLVFALQRRPILDARDVFEADMPEFDQEPLRHFLEQRISGRSGDRAVEVAAPVQPSDVPYQMMRERMNPVTTSVAITTTKITASIRPT
jgi:hypothetical protein